MGCTQAELDQVSKYLNAFLETRGCPLCGWRSMPTFQLASVDKDPLFLLRLWVPPAKAPATPYVSVDLGSAINTLPVVAITCRNCSHLAFFSAKGLGLCDEKGQLVIPTDYDIEHMRRTVGKAEHG